MPEPQELKEYQYVVNNTVTTAMLTPAMAERLSAKPVGSDDAATVGGYSSEQNQAVYATTGMSSAVVGGDAVEPIRVQQKGIDEQGRTKSMRSPKEQGQAGADDESTTESAAKPDALAKTRKAQDK